MSALWKKFGDDYQIVSTSSSGLGLQPQGLGQGSQQQLVPKKKQQQLVDKNGQCNVQHDNLGRETSSYLSDLLTTLMDLKWRWNLFISILTYTTAWLFMVSTWWMIAYTWGDLNTAHVGNYTPCVPSFSSSRLRHRQLWLPLHHRQVPQGHHPLSLPVHPRLHREHFPHRLHVHQDVPAQKVHV